MTVCNICKDTHLMEFRHKIVDCIYCPLPCSKCMQSTNPYCKTIPCGCQCHPARSRPEPDYGPVPLNPGIVKVVGLLRQAGFETCDSGDGETHAMEGDSDVGYVAVSSSPETMIHTAHAIESVLKENGIEADPGPDGRGVSIQCTYDVSDRRCVIIVSGIHDRMLK